MQNNKIALFVKNLWGWLFRLLIIAKKTNKTNQLDNKNEVFLPPKPDLPSFEVPVGDKNRVLVQTEWDIFVATHLSVETRRAYQNDFKDFLVYWRGLSSEHLYLDQITLENLVHYRNKLESSLVKGKKLSKTSLNRKIATLKSFIRHCQDRGFLEMPIKLLKSFPQSSYSATQAFSDPQVRLLLEQVNLKTKTGSLHYAILLILFHLGLRRSECASLTYGSIIEERGIRSIQVYGKGDRIRRLPIPENVWQALLRYWKKNPRELSAESPLFCAVKKSYHHKTKPQHLCSSQIYTILKKYQKKAGIKGKFSPHSARATAISNAIDHNAHVSQIQYFAGWSTPTMMTRYDKRRSQIENSAVFKISFDETPTEEQEPLEAPITKKGA